MLQKLVKIALFAFAVYFAYYIFSTSTYVRFWADDFCTAFVLDKYGFLGAQKFSWLTWSGRFTYNFFIYLLMALGPFITKILPIVTFILLALSIWGVFHKLTLAKSKTLSLVLSFVFVIVVFMNTPNIIQSLYWYSGSLAYTFPFIIINLFLSMVLWVNVKYLKNHRKLIIFIAFFILLIAGGFSETFVVSGIVFIVFFALINYLYEWDGKNEAKRIFLAGLAGLMISFLIVYFSPGTASRASTVDKPESLGWVISATYDSTKLFFIDLFDIKAFIYTFVLVFSSVWLIKRMLSEKKRVELNYKKTINILALGVCLAIFTCASVYAASYFSMAYHPPERAMIIPIYIIIICLIIVSINICNILLKVGDSYLIHGNKFVVLAGKFKNIINGIFILLFIVSLILIGRDTQRQWSFIKNDLKTYADEWDIQKEKIIRQKDSGNAVKVKYIPPVGRVDGFRENKGWVAGCAAKYFGVDKFVIE